MIEVIKEGDEHLPKKYEVKCHCCGSILRYLSTDTVTIQCNEIAVVCPICKSYVDHNEKSRIK